MFISPSVYLTKCFLTKLCSLGQPLPKFAVVCNFVNHCNRAITFQALQPGGRLLFIADQQHTQSFNVRHTATSCFCSGCTGCFGSRLHRLLGCSAALAALAACPLWLLAFIPYAKVKKLILTHYILFIWKDKCMFFSDAAFPSRMLFSLFPMDLPGISISATAPRPAALPQRPSQQLCHGSASLQSLRHGVPASISASAPLPATSSRWRSATAPLPATNLIRRRRVLRFG